MRFLTVFFTILLSIPLCGCGLIFGSHMVSVPKDKFDFYISCGNHPCSICEDRNKERREQERREQEMLRQEWSDMIDRGDIIFITANDYATSRAIEISTNLARMQSEMIRSVMNQSVMENYASGIRRYELENVSE